MSAGAGVQAVCVLQTDGGAEAWEYFVWNPRPPASSVQRQLVSAVHSAGQHVPGADAASFLRYVFEALDAPRSFLKALVEGIPLTFFFFPPCRGEPAFPDHPPQW